MQKAAPAPFTSIAFIKWSPAQLLAVQFGTAGTGYHTYTYNHGLKGYVGPQGTATVKGDAVTFTNSAGKVLAEYIRVREMVPQGNWTNVDDLSMDFQVYSVGCGDRTTRFPTVDDVCAGYPNPCGGPNLADNTDLQPDVVSHPKKTRAVPASGKKAARPSVPTAKAESVAAKPKHDPKLWGDNNAEVGGLLTNDKAHLPNDFYYYRQTVTGNPNSYWRPASGSTMTQVSDHLIFHQQKNGRLRFYVRQGRLYGPSFKIDGAWKRLSGSTAHPTMTVNPLTSGAISVAFGGGARTFKPSAYNRQYHDPSSGSTVTFLENHAYYRGANQKLIAAFGR
ncbi:hypothetical protein [Acanthopleuribacter pedis]|uniref:Uncharacterized protein n=1 Tax=Acanthopleuribacter pedis TaxID=442870 RepID=A0A8J7QL59_9BACT|nr:hypothetical protein [Acanthopleuribacter pedis]MBO1321920.1 hypothetical protein [Acanthopleuribacter pedis]